MSKFNTLWEFVGQQRATTLKLTFAEIREIAGIEIDHSFLNFKKELVVYGYQVGKISLKEQTVLFHKIER